MNPRNAKLCKNIWLPDTETHFVDMIAHNKKRHEIRDGKGTYQVHKLDAAMGYVKKRRTCIDIGAHVGLWSMHLVKLFDFVEAFEPVDHHAYLFPFNVPEANYKLHKVALGDHEGSVDIVVPPDQTGNAHIVGEGKISLIPLDDYRFTKVDFIKIDVEGYELPVVKGARETLLRNKPIIVVEQKGNDVKFYGGQRNEALNWLQSIGARVLKVISGDYIMGW